LITYEIFQAANLINIINITNVITQANPKILNPSKLSKALYIRKLQVL